MKNGDELKIYTYIDTYKSIGITDTFTLHRLANTIGVRADRWKTLKYSSTPRSMQMEAKK